MATSGPRLDQVTPSSPARGLPAEGLQIGPVGAL
jgi:hypothetical protein